MVVRQKRGMCAHVREGDEDMITQKYKPQNEILGFSQSVPTKSSHSRPVPAVLSFPRPLSCFIGKVPFSLLILRSLILSSTLHPFTVNTSWSRYLRLTILLQCSQNKCNISCLCFNKGWVCAMSSTFSKAVFESPCYYPSLLLNLFVIPWFSNLRKHPLPVLHLHPLSWLLPVLEKQIGLD